MLVEVSRGPAEPGLPEFREFDGCEPRGFEKQGGPGNPSPGSEPAGCSFGECHAAIMGAEGYGFVEPQKIPGEPSAGGDQKPLPVSFAAHLPMALRGFRKTYRRDSSLKRKKGQSRTSVLAFS
jgi:hypothetical protein